MIKIEWFFNDSIDSKPRKLYNPKHLREITRENIKLDDKQLNEEMAEKTINPFCFTNRAIKVGFIIRLDSHHINLTTSEKLIIQNI